MAEPKTKKDAGSVDEFISGVDEKRRGDCQTLIDLMRDVTGEEPAMWGPSMVGFGSYHYKYASGREGDWFVTGFSPRKQNLTLYVMSGFEGYDALLGKLGKHTTGKACLYVKKLDDVDHATLRELVERSVAHMSSSSG